MIFSDIATQPTVKTRVDISEPTSSYSHYSHKPRKYKADRLHYMMWICLLIACAGTSWFAYQYFLVPQPASFTPDWHGSQWVKAADANAPVASFTGMRSNSD